MICVIDTGNSESIAKALRHLKYPHTLSRETRIIQEADKIIFPGVGSFATAANHGQKTGLFDFIKQKVSQDKTPILGICLGMQLLASKGFENGESDGLGFFDAEVKKLRSDPARYRIPHVGWNDVSVDDSVLYEGIPQKSCFYFVHSYEMQLKPTFTGTFATTDYDHPVVASVSRGNIHGVQFHPEKSQESGLKLLTNFIELC